MRRQRICLRREYYSRREYNYIKMLMREIPGRASFFAILIKFITIKCTDFVQKEENRL